MKRLLFAPLMLVLFFVSCKKDNDEIADNTIEATINGTKVTFKVESATLFHFQVPVKRLEISCYSLDFQKHIFFYLNNTENLKSDDIEIKTYKVGEVFYPDPYIRDYDGEGDFMYSTRRADNWMIRSSLPVEGKILVSSNNVNEHTISGSFDVNYRDNSNNTIHTEIKSGKFRNVKYKVIK